MLAPTRIWPALGSSRSFGATLVLASQTPQIGADSVCHWPKIGPADFGAGKSGVSCRAHTSPQCGLVRTFLAVLGCFTFGVCHAHFGVLCVFSELSRLFFALNGDYFMCHLASFPEIPHSGIPAALVQA